MFLTEPHELIRYYSKALRVKKKKKTNTVRYKNMKIFETLRHY